MQSCKPMAIKIPVNFNDACSIEMLHSNSTDSTCWRQNAPEHCKGEVVHYLNYRFTANSDTKGTKGTPFDSDAYTMLPASAIRQVCEQLRVDEVVVIVNKGEVIITTSKLLKESPDKWLIRGGTDHVRCNAYGTSAYALKAAISSLASHKSLKGHLTKAA